MNIVLTVFTTIVVSVYCRGSGVAAFRSSSSRTVVVSPSFVLATRGGASDGSESSSSSNSKHDAKLEIAKSKAIERAYVKVCGVIVNVVLYIFYIGDSFMRSILTLYFSSSCQR